MITSNWTEQPLAPQNLEDVQRSLVLDDLNALELRQGLADGAADQKAGNKRQDPLESRPPG